MQVRAIMGAGPPPAPATHASRRGSRRAHAPVALDAASPASHPTRRRIPTLAPRAGRKVESSELPLHHFDALFRAWGSVLVLGVLGVRFAAGVLLPGLYRLPEVLAPGVLYGLQAGFRFALYQLHARGPCARACLAWACLQGLGAGM